MITEIGIAAGDIWHFLDGKSPTTLKEIMGKIDAPRDRILMSLGWLAREGHVNVKRDKKEYIITLVQ